MVSKIHCIHTHDLDTGKKRDFKPDEIDAGLQHLSQANELWGHYLLQEPCVIDESRWLEECNAAMDGFAQKLLDDDGHGTGVLGGEKCRAVQQEWRRLKKFYEAQCS